VSKKEIIMLEGLNRTDGKIIKLWQMDDDAIRQIMHEIRDNRDMMTCFMPDCGCSMHVRALDSDKKVAHFARYPNTGGDSHPASGESLEHMLEKSKLAQWLQKRYPFAEITTEKTLDIGEGGYRKTRRVDVFVTLADGQTEAHEIQRSYQNTAKTERRTNDYKMAGVNRVVWWWAGKASDNDALKEWCINNCDFYGKIRTPRKSFMGKLIAGDPEFDIYDCQSIKRKREKEAAEYAARKAAIEEAWQKRKEAEKESEQRMIEERQRRILTAQNEPKYTEPVKPAEHKRTVIFPADVKLAFPEGTWQRLPDGRIKARLTLPEMRLVDAWGRMLRGDDVADGELLPQWAVA
jgi:competence CoiA-like predicted nuclease